MSYRVEISLKNNLDEDVLCIIPKGQVFENKKVGSGFQNVAASREYRLIIPAKSSIKVEIEAYCINRSLSPPSGNFGNITIFKIDKPFNSQDELWDLMRNPVV